MKKPTCREFQEMWFQELEGHANPEDKKLIWNFWSKKTIDYGSAQKYRNPDAVFGCSLSFVSPDGKVLAKM